MNGDDAVSLPPPSGAHRLSDFDFELPPELIAQQPAAERARSRLLDGRGVPARPPIDRVFHDLAECLAPEDLLVFNDTRVIKARLLGHKETGGHVEVLVERVLPPFEAWAHVRASRSPRVGARLRFAHAASGETLEAEVLARGGPGQALFRLGFASDVFALLERYGHVPLPPYITHGDDAQDERRYQTVFAARPGAVAAPTAALHFDAALLARIAARGVASARVTLHVGAGTFQPVRSEDLALHAMHSEWFEVPEATVDAIARARAARGRIVAVGTTTVRALESAALAAEAAGRPGTLAAGARETRIFITPGYDFRVADRLITNFHLPRSTLMMLVSAFAGMDTIRALYAHAIAARYRFFSYGDAMLLARPGAAGGS